jgi:hypothetical protein
VWGGHWGLRDKEEECPFLPGDSQGTMHQGCVCKSEWKGLQSPGSSVTCPELGWQVTRAQGPAEGPEDAGALGIVRWAVPSLGFVLLRSGPDQRNRPKTPAVPGGERGAGPPCTGWRGGEAPACLSATELVSEGKRTVSGPLPSVGNPGLHALRKRNLIWFPHPFSS